MGLRYDPKLIKALEALQEAGKRMMEEAKKRNPPTSFNPFAPPDFDVYKNFTERFQVSFDDIPLKDCIIINLNEFNPIPYYNRVDEDMEFNLPENLTTSQKMRVFQFIIALETAEEL